MRIIPIANKIKEFEQKIEDLGASKQMLLFQVEVEKTVNGIQMGVLENGIPYLTERGLASLCDIHRKTLYRISSEWENQDNNRVKKLKSLMPEFKEESLVLQTTRDGKINNVYPDIVNEGSIFDILLSKEEIL